MMKKRKWLASLLAVVMVLAMMPTMAFAAEDTVEVSNGMPNGQRGWIYPTKQKPKQMKRKAGAGVLMEKAGIPLFWKMSIYPPNRVMPLHFRTM